MSGTSGGRFSGGGRGRGSGRGKYRPPHPYSNPRNHHRSDEYGHYGPDRSYEDRPSPPRERDWQSRSDRGHYGKDSRDRFDDRYYDNHYDDRYRGDQGFHHNSREYSRHPTDGFSSDDGFRSPSRRHVSHQKLVKFSPPPPSTSNSFAILALEEQAKQGQAAAAKLAAIRQESTTGRGENEEGQTGGAVENTVQAIWSDGWGRTTDVLKIEEITETTNNEKNEGDTGAKNEGETHAMNEGEKIEKSTEQTEVNERKNLTPQKR